MSTITVSLKDRSYPIIVGRGVLASFGILAKKFHLGTDAVIVSNKNIRKLYGAKIQRALASHKISVKFLDIADSEQSKSQRTAFRLIEQIARYDVDRKIFLVALGGGVVGDVTGFVASIYKRGVPFVQAPTTLLAQVDSAIGGKTAIDLSTGKNLVGAFYQPRMVLSDVGTLRSLSQRQLRNGLAEVIKYGAICDAQLFRYIEANSAKILSCDEKALAVIVKRCSAIKARIVSLDEKEALGVRTILNFGHTIGHGIETACRYGRYQHGEAVALGMRAAGCLSVRLGFLTQSEQDRLERVLTISGLPTTIRGASVGRILDAASRDKKNIGKKNRFVLLKKIGQAKVFEGIPPALMKDVVRQYSS